MQWRITGTLYETDGKTAKGQIELQAYDVPRQRWYPLAKSDLNAKGEFKLTLELTDNKLLPAIRLCEPVQTNQNTRVLAEGGLVRIVSARLGHLAFGEIVRLGDQSVTRSERAAPFSSCDDYLLVGAPRPPTQSGPTVATMATMRFKPDLVLQSNATLNSAQIRAQAILTKQLEEQAFELKNKVEQITTLEKSQHALDQDLRQARLQIQNLEKQLKARPTSNINNEQIELATQQIRLTMNEQIIKQATEFELQQSALQRTLNTRNIELANLSERVQELSSASTTALEEAARAQEENEQLQNQLESQINAGDLYSSIAQQLQQTQAQLKEDGSAYRLGRVSLNVKTLLSGNQLTLPNRADLLKANPGLFTDVSLEYLPDSIDPDDTEPSVSVPDFSDLTETLARRLAGDLGLQLEAAYQSVDPSKQSIGQAIRQLPAKGTQVADRKSVV